MSGIRKSMIFALEDTLGGGKGKNRHWMHVPPGTFFSHASNRSTNRIDAMGTKKYDAIAQGKVSGTWSWGFNLDQDQLEPMMLVFESVNDKVIADEVKGKTSASDFAGSANVQTWIKAKKSGYTFQSTDDTVTLTTRPAEPTDKMVYRIITFGEGGASDTISQDVALIDADSKAQWYSLGEEKDEYRTVVDSIPTQVGEDGNTYEYTVTVNNAVQISSDGETPVKSSTATTSVYTHVFKKVDTARVPSFCVRIVTLNEMAGGTVDEVLEIRGLVCKTASFRQSAGSSQTAVSLEGFSTKEHMWLGDLSSTDQQVHEGQLVEFSCAFLPDDDDTEVCVDDNRLRWVDSVSINITNNAEVVDSTCTPFSPGYREGKSEYGLSLSMYSVDPLTLQQRVYSGGQNVNYIGGEYIQGNKPTKSGYLTTAMCKGLAPLEKMTVISYNTCCRDHINDQVGDTITKAIANSTRSFRFDITKIVIKSMSWQRGDNEKLQDALSSSECRDITITARSDVANWLANTANQCDKPVGPEWNESTQTWKSSDDSWKS